MCICVHTFGELALDPMPCRLQRLILSSQSLYEANADVILSYILVQRGYHTSHSLHCCACGDLRGDLPRAAIPSGDGILLGV